jgi:hypothetical protein
VVLTRRVHRDVLDQHQFVVLLVERGVEHVVGIDVEAGEHLPVRPCHPRRGVDQALALRVLSNGDQQLAHGGFGSDLVELGEGERGRIDLRPRHLVAPFVSARRWRVVAVV